MMANFMTTATTPLNPIMGYGFLIIVLKWLGSVRVSQVSPIFRRTRVIYWDLMEFNGIYIDVMVIY